MHVVAGRVALRSDPFIFARIAVGAIKRLDKEQDFPSRSLFASLIDRNPFPTALARPNECRFG